MLRTDSVLLSVFLLMLAVAGPAATVHAGGPIKDILPARECSRDWIIEDKMKFFDRDTLFEHINGEAELYRPYGFEALAAAIYTSRQNPQVSILADVYRMGSPLDAFGIFSNYRRPSYERIAMGAEGYITSSQLMFYQDRYYVRLQASGTSDMKREVFLSCGEAISQNLPRPASRPQEIDALKIPEVVPNSERYIAQSLLGYAFFRRGLMAEAVLGSEGVQVFVIREDSPDAARKAVGSYLAELRASGRIIRTAEGANLFSLEAVDSLYGGVFLEQAGRYIVGAVRVQEPAAAKPLVEKLRGRLGSGD